MIRRPTEMRVEKREKMRGGDGTVTIVHYLEKEEFASKTRLCARLVLPPGAGIGQHQHEGEDEVYLIVGGSGLLNDGKSESRVSKGDAVMTGRGECHSIRNDGTEPLEIIAVINCY